MLLKAVSLTLTQREQDAVTKTGNNARSQINGTSEHSATETQGEYTLF